MHQPAALHGFAAQGAAPARAEGAVLNTGGHAAQLGYKVILPVDASSSATLYAEQYSAWHLANAPTIGQQTTVTRTDMVSF